jgi:hypothetical protein
MSHPWKYRDSASPLPLPDGGAYRKQGDGVACPPPALLRPLRRVRSKVRQGRILSRFLNALPAEFYLLIAIALYHGYWALIIWLTGVGGYASR